MRGKVLAVAKWIWLGLVLAFAVIFLVRRGPMVAATLRAVAPWQVGLAILLLILAKLVLVQVSRLSLRVEAPRPSYRSMFYINGVTQVGKYLPGGIWHFVGKFAYYRAAGIAPARATRAMVIENAWLVASALCFGLLFILPLSLHPSGLAGEWLANVPGLPQALVLALWWLLLVAIEVVRRRQLGRGWIRSAGLVLIQGACWLLAGLSFVSLFPQPLVDGSLGAGLGAFAMAWAIGYLTIFAPGGLGARELVLVVLLAPVMSAEQAVTLAALHRVIWTAVEILFGSLAMLGDVAGVAWGVSRPRQEQEAEG